MEIRKVWNPNTQEAPSPSPIPMRQCVCGCKCWFQPERKDKIYLNHLHANYGYNHGKRKLRNKKISDLNKSLALNDRILERFFNAQLGNPIVAPLINLKIEGFIDTLYLSINNKNEETYFFLYNYAFTIYTKNNQKLVKIIKLRKNESV